MVSSNCVQRARQSQHPARCIFTRAARREDNSPSANNSSSSSDRCSYSRSMVTSRPLVPGGPGSEPARQICCPATYQARRRFPDNSVPRPAGAGSADPERAGHEHRHSLDCRWLKAKCSSGLGAGIDVNFCVHRRSIQTSRRSFPDNFLSARLCATRKSQPRRLWRDVPVADAETAKERLLEQFPRRRPWKGQTKECTEEAGSEVRQTARSLRSRSRREPARFREPSPPVATIPGSILQTEMPPVPGPHYYTFPRDGILFRFFHRKWLPGTSGQK